MATLPRSGYTSVWTQGAGAMSIALPAIPGIAHVVTLVEMLGYSYSATSAIAGFAVQVTLSSTTLGTITLKLFGVPPTTAAGGLNPWDETWSGEIHAAPGELVTVQYGGGVNGAEFLGVHWYDL